MRSVIVDLPTILRMDMKDVWTNYVAAMDVWVSYRDKDLCEGPISRGERHSMMHMMEVSKRCLDVYQDRIEEELW